MFEPSSSSCYAVYPQTTNWNNAESICVGIGGHLVTIDDAAENDFIRGLFPSGNILLGYNDKAVEGTFVWADGSASSYTNWNVGEPNNGTSEDCAEMYTTGLWNDRRCNNGNQHFVCEAHAP